MREFELVIDKALKKGLYPGATLPSNVEFLWQALGFRVGKYELEGYVECDQDPLSALDISYIWPFPQFFQGDGYNILVIRSTTFGNQDLVYLVSDTYTITLIHTIDEIIYGQGTLMEFADFGEYIFMTNGVIMIYWDPDLGPAGDWQEVRTIANIPMMRTVCNFKGQMIGGGVRGSYNAVTDVYDTWHGCDETSIVWSKIGEADFTPTRRNEAGFRNDPYGGEVYHVRRLGDNVIVYSSKGITRMFPVKTPAATFGFEELDDTGLYNRGALDCSLDRHVYVGTDLIVREITTQGIMGRSAGQSVVKELGYSIYIDETDHSSEDIIVKYDKAKKDFYIGTSEKTYLLSPYGMTEVPQHPSAIWTIDSYDDETNMLPVAMDDYTPLISSEIFDMGYRGQKTVFSVETDAFLVLEPKASIGWLNTLFIWGQTDYVPLNNQGIASIIADGSDFIVVISFTNIARAVSMGYIKVRFKMTDMRGMRGVYAPPPRGQK